MVSHTTVVAHRTLVLGWTVVPGNLTPLDSLSSNSSRSSSRSNLSHTTPSDLTWCTLLRVHWPFKFKVFLMKSPGILRLIKEKIDWLNLGIHQENFRNNARAYPGFHTYGVRTATRSYTDEYGQVHQRKIKAHRWEHWRESDPARMLHLRNDRRFKMGIAVNNYFILNTNCSTATESIRGD